MRRAIALLITLMFIMAITISIGVGLSYTKRAQNTLKDENFLLQSNIILNDVLALLKKSQELKLLTIDKTGEALNIFLSQSSFIPFSSSGIDIALEISSARSKFNPNALISADKKKIDYDKVMALQVFLEKRMLNPTYVEILLDGLGGVKEDMSYNSDIFNSNETLYRDAIFSKQHLEVFNEFYTNTFYDNSLKLVKFDKLFYFVDDASLSSKYEIDLNYATADVWELMLGVDATRAEELALGGGYYSEKNKANYLSNDEIKALENFNTTYEPQLLLDVNVEIIQDKFSSSISFEYDIKNRKGYNFSYEI